MAGEVDARFGQCGTVVPPVVPIPVHEAARSVAIQADGMILAAGFADPSSGPGAKAVPLGGALDAHGTRNFRVMRLDPDGRTDAAFDGVPANTNEPLRLPGRATIDFQGRGDAAAAVDIQPDGKIVVAGSAAMVASAVATNVRAFEKQ